MHMQDLWNTVSRDRVISRIAGVLPDNTYLVGGCVRDILLKKRPSDYDIVCFSDVEQLAENIARMFDANAFWLDKQREVARLNIPSKGIMVDVSAPKGEDIRTDLLSRDITINAIGLDIRQKKLVDPANGRSDLNSGIIRVISEKNLKDDPLRVLRCLRLALELGFDIEPSTRAMLKRNAHLVDSAAPERIGYEFMKSLSVSGGSRLFTLMEDLSLIGVFFPQYAYAKDMEQGRHHRWPLLRHVILTAEEADGLISKAESYLEGIGDYFLKEVSLGITRGALLKLSAFLHDIGKSESRIETPDGGVHFYGHAARGEDIARAFCKRIRMPEKAERIVTGIVARHMALLELACTGEPSRRNLARFLDASKGFVPEILLHALADARATGKPAEHVGSGPFMEALVRRAWEYYRGEYSVLKARPLLNGKDVMEILGCPPGPHVGKALNMLMDARADGILKTKEDAINYIISRKRAILHKTCD